MLILSRKPGESIIIGNDEVRVTVVRIDGIQVKIGVDCDREIPVHREEIYQKIQGEKAESDGGESDEWPENYLPERGKE